jgi:hypothetical protein
MEERDTFPFGAEAGCFVDEADACGFATRERAVEIVNREANVVNAGTSFGDELADWRLGGVGLEELNERLAGLHSGNAGAVGIVKRDLRHAEDVAVEGKDLIKCLHGDAHVGDAGGAIG